jgi:hypothetical protein
VANGGGELFPQPPEPGAEGRFDDFIGGGFLVVAREQDQIGPAGDWWTRKGAIVCTVAELPDPNAWIVDWMRRRETDVVVVRPDHYVLGVGRDLNEITALVTPWLDPTPAPSSASVVN